MDQDPDVSTPAEVQRAMLPAFAVVQTFRGHHAPAAKASGPDPDHGLQYIASHPPTSERIERFDH